MIIEVNDSSVTVDQWSTGVFLKVDSIYLSDRFLVEYEHSDETLNSEALTLQRIGKTYKDFALVPIPNYLLTVAGTVTVYYDGGLITVTVNSVAEPSGYATNCQNDIDVDRAATEDVETRLSDVWKLIYPVGSIYISVNSASPETLFGGTWERIEDTFLLASGSNHSAGDTGGSETFELTVADHHHSNVGTSRYSVNTEETVTSGRLLQNTTDSGGFTEIIDTMPPYLAVYMWKRVEDEMYAEFIDADGNNFIDADGKTFMVEV